MTVWNLEPGAEQPVTRRPPRVGNLTAADIVRRCGQLGARVERASGGGWRVFPPDRARPPVSVPSRLQHGRGHLNVVTALRRAGLDVTTEPAKETAMPTPTDVPRRPAGGPTAAVVAELREQVETMLGMLAEADTRNRQLAERVDRLTARLDATPGAPPERDPHADLDEAIVALLRTAGIKLPPAAVAANLDGDHPADLVEQRLTELAARGDLALDESAPGTHLYRLPAAS